MESPALKQAVSEYLSSQRAGPAAEQAISFARLRVATNVGELQADVSKLLLHFWVNHVNTRDYRGVWDVLPLRCQRRYFNSNPILQSFAIEDNDTWEDLPVLELCPSIKRVLDYLQCPIKAVRLMRLKADAEIKPHRDHQLSIEFGEARLHMPIHTSDAVSFFVDKKLIPMSAGELWYFNADQLHEVYNQGGEDRINLVIDCIANEWLCKKIVAAIQDE